MAERVGISQARQSDIESGRVGVPLGIWFAEAAALGRYLRFEFGRDPELELRDAGHLQMQDLVLRLAKAAGWEGGFEIPTRPADPARSIDVSLLDRRRRQLAIVECWNTFGDLGAATRSSDRKVADARQAAVAKAGGGEPFAVGLCWVVRDTAANRVLITRYEHIFETRFAGSSRAWVRALTELGAPLPTQPGLVWCDARATRVFAHRRAQRTRQAGGTR